MFFGEYNGKIDAKGRLMIPSQFRKNCVGNQSFILKKSIYEQSLDLYSAEEWKAEAKKVEEKLNIHNREDRILLREYYRGIAEVNLDSSGRILLPKRLMEAVAIDKEIVIAGAGDKMTIWAEQVYEDVALSQGDFEALMSEKLG